MLDLQFFSVSEAAIFQSFVIIMDMVLLVGPHFEI